VQWWGGVFNSTAAMYTNNVSARAPRVVGSCQVESRDWLSYTLCHETLNTNSADLEGRRVRLWGGGSGIIIIWPGHAWPSHLQSQHIHDDSHSNSTSTTLSNRKKRSFVFHCSMQTPLKNPIHSLPSFQQQCTVHVAVHFSYTFGTGIFAALGSRSPVLADVDADAEPRHRRQTIN